MASIDKRPQKYVAVGSFLPNKISYTISSVEGFEEISVLDADGNLLFKKKQRVVSGVSEFELSHQLRSFVENKPFEFFGTIEDKNATQQFYITGASIDDAANIRFAVASSLNGYEESLLPFISNQNNLTKFLQSLPKIVCYDISGCWLSILTDTDFVQFVSAAYTKQGVLIQTSIRNQDLTKGGMARIYLPYVSGASYGDVFINQVSILNPTNLAGGSDLIHTQYDNRTGINTLNSVSDVPAKTTFLGSNVIRIDNITPNNESQKPYWNIAFTEGKTYAITLNAFGLVDTNLVSEIDMLVDVWLGVDIPSKITQLPSKAFNVNQDIEASQVDLENSFLYTHTEVTGTYQFGIGAKNVLDLEKTLSPSLYYVEANTDIMFANPNNATSTLFNALPIAATASKSSSYKNDLYICQSGNLYRIYKDSNNNTVVSLIDTGVINDALYIDRSSAILHYLVGTNGVKSITLEGATVTGVQSSILTDLNADINIFSIGGLSGNVVLNNVGELTHIPSFGGNKTEISTDSLAFTVDWAKNLVYHVIDSAPTDTLLRTYNITTGQWLSIVSLPLNVSKLDIDTINQKLYYLANNEIRRIDIDGTNDTLMQSDVTGINDFTFAGIEESNVNLDFLYSQLQVLEVEVNNQSSEVQMVHYEQTRCDATQLVWANNIGGWDTFVFDGYRTETFEIENTERFTDFTQRTETNVIRGGRDRHTLSAGLLDIDTCKALKGLYTSKYVYKVEKNVFTPVIIATNSFVILNTKDKLFEVSFDILLPRNNL